MYDVRPAGAADSKAWLSMRCDFWPDGSEAEHASEIERYFSGQAAEPAMVLVAEDEEKRLVGVVELSIRPCAQDCLTNRIGYLEGWYVVPEARGRGIGRSLVRAGEEWARSQGCTEFASDSRPDNDVSVAAHLALGFTDAGLIRCFRKDL